LQQVKYPVIFGRLCQDRHNILMGYRLKTPLSLISSFSSCEIEKTKKRRALIVNAAFEVLQK